MKETKGCPLYETSCICVGTLSSHICCLEVVSHLYTFIIQWVAGSLKSSRYVYYG